MYIYVHSINGYVVVLWYSWKTMFFLQAKMETFTRIRELVSRFRRVPGRSKSWWLGAREIVGEIGGVRQTQWFRKDSFFICIYTNNMMVCIHIIYALYCIYIYLFIYLCVCLMFDFDLYLFVWEEGTGHVHVLAPNMSPSGAWFPWSLPGSAPILVVIVQWKSIETPASNIIKEDHGMLIVYHSISFHYIYHMYGSCLQYTSIYYMYIYTLILYAMCHGKQSYSYTIPMYFVFRFENYLHSPWTPTRLP